MTDEAALFTSGLFDSLGLIELAAWLERELGRQLDASQIELLKHCDTIPEIARFMNGAAACSGVEPRDGAGSASTGDGGSGRYEVVRYHPGLAGGIAELQTHLWSPDVRLNAAYLDWKYGRNPYLERPFLYVALYRGRPVGMRGFFGAEWEFGLPSETRRVLCAGDLVISPVHRNRGLVKLIMEAALRDLFGNGHTHVFNLSASLSTYMNSLVMGWRDIGPLQPLHRRDGSATRPLGAHPFEALDRDGVGPGGSAGGALTVAVEPRPQVMAELVRRVGSDGRVRHVRDERYLSWRFQNPLSRYRFLFWETDRLEGYLVLQTSVGDERKRVNIVDWEGLGPAARSQLLRAAVELGRFEDLRVWSAGLPRDGRLMLAANGFTPVETVPGTLSARRPTVLVKDLREPAAAPGWLPAGRSILNLDSWDMRMMYSDAF